MEQLDVLKLLVSKLEKASTHYFITGSIASSYYGIPRFTHDIDVLFSCTLRPPRNQSVQRLSGSPLQTEDRSQIA